VNAKAHRAPRQLPDLARFRELRPDLLFPTQLHSTAVYLSGLKAIHDLQLPGTEDALLDWVAERYPDPRARRRPGRPRVTAATALRRYEKAVRELRKDGKPPTNDRQVAEHLGLETERQITEWRGKFGLPHVRDVLDE